MGLPLQYPGWSKDHLLHSWAFYGADLEQGLLFHYFYALPKSLDTSADDKDLLTIMDDDMLRSFGIYHFYGKQKPWISQQGGVPPHKQTAQTRWTMIYDTLDTTPVDALLSTLAPSSTPLTGLGLQRARMNRVLYEEHGPSASPTAAPQVSNFLILVCALSLKV